MKKKVSCFFQPVVAEKIWKPKSSTTHSPWYMKMSYICQILSAAILTRLVPLLSKRYPRTEFPVPPAGAVTQYTKL